MSRGDVDAAGEWYWSGNVLTAYSTSNPASAFSSVRAMSRERSLSVSDQDWLNFDNLDFTEARSVVFLVDAHNLNFTEVNGDYSGNAPVWSIRGTSHTITLTNSNGQYGGGGIKDDLQGPHGMKSFDATTGVVIDGGAWSHNTEDGFTTSSAGVGTVLTIRNVTSEDNGENALDIKDGIVVVEDVVFRTNMVRDPTITVHNRAESLMISGSQIEVEDGIATNALNVSAGAIASNGNLYIGGNSNTINLDSSASSSFINDIILRTIGSGGTAAVLVKQGDHTMDHVTIYLETNKRGVDIRGDGAIDLDNSILYAVDGVTAALLEVETIGELTGDNNFLYRVTGATYVDWDGTDYTARQVTDGTLQAAEGLGDTWITGLDPTFVDADGGDFTLQSGSTATGLGATTDDAFGL